MGDILVAEDLLVLEAPKAAEGECPLFIGEGLFLREL
jgi:hypothetical protein